MTPFMEADLSERFTAPEGVVLPLTSQGLVALPSESSASQVSWRFPAMPKADFQSRGVTSNFSVEVTNLYKTGADGETVTVRQSLPVEKTLEKRASEAADMILKLRRTRVQIITGDTDMTYSGQAMGDAVAEMKRLEKEYLSLFVGYTDVQPQVYNVEVVPDASKSSQQYVAFRLSETDGAVAADDLSGKPVVLELTPEAVAPVAAGDAKVDNRKFKDEFGFKAKMLSFEEILQLADTELEGYVPDEAIMNKYLEKN